jgi:hypothetical protein
LLAHVIVQRFWPHPIGQGFGQIIEHKRGARLKVQVTGAS